MHARLGLLTLRQRTSGGGTAAPGPTVTNVSATGTVPLVLSISDPNASVQDEGARIQWEFAGSLTPAKNADGSYTTTTQSGVSFIYGDAIGRLDEAIGYNDPSGAFAFHFRILVDNESGVTSVTDQLGQTNTYTAGPWSNDYTDTINVSVAQWATPAGTNASQYLTLSNGNLTCTMNNTVNANCGIRTTISASGKRHFEFTVVSHGNQSSGSLGIGVVDGTTALGAAVFPKPGASGGPSGAHWALKSGATATNVYRNGAGPVTGSSLSTALADGDLVAIEFDTTANTVSLFHKPGAGAWYTVQTLTLTSLIPASWYAYSCGYGETGAGTTPPADAWTANFGGSTFSMTPSTGYLMYG